MAPTPPSGGTASSASRNSEDRTRRVVACVNCRNSKARCRSDKVPGQPCQRCARLSVPCIVDKCHKRAPTRSKLEQLEQELHSIQQVVHPLRTTGVGTSLALPSSRATYPNLSEIQDRAFAPDTRLASTLVSGPSAKVPKQSLMTGPPEARWLGDHLISGEDVDRYFKKFLQCFHPALPILRKRDPDECYEASPTLFWVVIYVTCRRYTKSCAFFHALVDQVEKDVSALLTDPAMTLETLHAILFLCAWPLPKTRLLADPSTMYITIALTAAMMLGLHTGRGNHDQFCVGARKDYLSSNEDASSTWMACCVLAQRISTTSGHPPPSIQHDDTRCRASLESPIWTDLVFMFDLCRFLNRFYTAMAVHTAAHGHATIAEVSQWEQEFETLKPAIITVQTDLYHALSLSSLLEIQVFYFSADPEAPPHIQHINYLRAFHTARGLIATVLELESRGRFLTHAASQIFLSLLNAACIVISILYSTSTPPDISINEENLLAKHAAAVLRCCSVEEGDLPHRISVVVETFWTVRHLIPRIEIGLHAWSDRLGAGLSFGCLELFKRVIRTAQENGGTVPAANSADALHYENRATQKRVQTAAAQSANENGAATTIPMHTASTSTSQPSSMLQLTIMAPYSSHEIDWPMLPAGLGWSGDDDMHVSLPPSDHNDTYRS